MAMAKSAVEEKFSEFFERWVSQLEELLRQLIRTAKETETTTSDNSHSQALVGRVTSHVKAYYTAKWAAAHEDVLAFFGPAWLSPLEAAFQWVTGWKPSTVFRLVEPKALSESQAKRIAELRVRIRLEEEKVEREMERQQVAMADRKTVELARLPEAGDGFAVEVVLKRLVSGLERVMKAADCVRLKALKGVLDELSPPQCVDFLAAHAALLLRIRHWGWGRSPPSGSSRSCCNMQSNGISPYSPTN